MTKFKFVVDFFYMTPLRLLAIIMSPTNAEENDFLTQKNFKISFFLVNICKRILKSKSHVATPLTQHNGTAENFAKALKINRTLE